MCSTAISESVCQVAQLERVGRLHHHVRRLAQALRRLELALRVDHLRASLALGLGLLGHRALHLLRQIDVLDLDRADLHAPGIRSPVELALKLVIDALSVGEQMIELALTADAAQGGLREL